VSPLHKSRTLLGPLLGALVCTLALAWAATASAASREPLAASYAALEGGSGTVSHSAKPDPRALRALQSGAQRAGGSDQVAVSSTYYGPTEMAEVASVIRRLAHGPELGRLSVYLATAAEIEQVCGAAVVACYVPSRMEMVVSGEGHGGNGVPREFTIAHEYGHHIANSQRADLGAPQASGTIRWATYERVCQFTRADELFPGDQSGHYWENPDEAFAESYAHLNEPSARVSWQYTPLLEPTTASLTKIRADVTRPWSGPVSTTWRDSVAAPPTPIARRTQGSGRAGLTSAAAVGEPSWIASRQVKTPLDGDVSVHLQASSEADLAVILRDAESDRVLARGRTGRGGAADLGYANCGRDSLRLEVRAVDGAGTFEATVAKP
jgi:hypothetical protein